MKKQNHEVNIIKTIFFALLILMTSCGEKIKVDDVKSIKLTIDPNNLENRFEVKIIENKDSLNMLIQCLNNKEIEPWKFLPKYKIEVNYAEKTEIFTGNNNHIKDENGKTYKLLDIKSELYKY